MNLGVITLDTELGSHYIGLLLHKLHVIAMQIRFMLLLLVLVPRLFGLSFCYFLVLDYTAWTDATILHCTMTVGVFIAYCLRGQWYLAVSIIYISGRFVYSVQHIALLHWWMTMNWNSLQSYSLYGKIAPQTSSTMDDVNVSKLMPLHHINIKQIEVALGYTIT